MISLVLLRFSFSFSLSPVHSSRRCWPPLYPYVSHSALWHCSLLLFRLYLSVDFLVSFFKYCRLPLSVWMKHSHHSYLRDQILNIQCILNVQALNISTFRYQSKLFRYRYRLIRIRVFLQQPTVSLVNMLPYFNRKMLSATAGLFKWWEIRLNFYFNVAYKELKSAV